MTQNYSLEYRFIPSLLHEVKQGRNPLESLIDTRWIKETLTNNHVDIDWDGFSIDVYDEAYNKTTLDKGKYIAYTFPPITSEPGAKYGVIDIEAMKYYTLESDYNNDYWAIGSQDVNCHALIKMVQKEMTLEEFMKSLNRPQMPPASRKGCLSVMVLIIAVVWGIVGLCSCGAKQKESKKEAVVQDSLMVDTTSVDAEEEEEESRRSLNDIRFENFKDKDWVDNDYVRTLRWFIDDYRRGKVVADRTSIEEIDKKELEDKFVILQVEPFVGGGLFLQIVFVDHPMDVYSAWVYSYVDENREVITGYECRLFKKEKEKSGYKTQKQLLDKVKTMPEIKLW